MYVVTGVADRDNKGKFVESSDSLHPKTIGLRLHKSHYQRFLDLANELGKRPTELARDVIEQWLDDREIGIPGLPSPDIPGGLPDLNPSPSPSNTSSQPKLIKVGSRVFTLDEFQSTRQKDIDIFDVGHEEEIPLPAQIDRIQASMLQSDEEEGNSYNGEDPGDDF